MKFATYAKYYEIKILTLILFLFTSAQSVSNEIKYYQPDFIQEYEVQESNLVNWSAIDFYVEGRRHFFASNYKAALRSFKSAVAKQNDFIPARAYLGLTFQKLGLLDAAAYHYRFSLQSGLPEDIAVLIEQYLYEYDKKNGISYYLKGNLSKGTNPNLQFELDTISVGGLVLTLDEASKAKPETALSLFGSVNYNKQINESTKLQSALNIDAKYYQKSKSYEYSIEPSLSLFYKNNPQNNYTWTLFQENKFGTKQKVLTGLGGRVNYQQSFRRNILGNGTLQYKKFQNLQIREKDGEEYFAAASLNFLTKNNAILKYGLEHTQHKIGIKSLSSKINAFNFTISKPLTERVRASASVSRTDQRYNKKSGIFGIKRHDTVLKAQVKLHFDQLEFQGLSPYVETTYTQRKSNISEFDSSDKSIFLGIDFAY